MMSILNVGWDRGAFPEDQSSGNNIESQPCRFVDRKLPRNTAKMHSIPSCSAFSPHGSEMFGVCLECNEHLNCCSSRKRFSFDHHLEAGAKFRWNARLQIQLWGTKCGIIDHCSIKFVQCCRALDGLWGERAIRRLASTISIGII